MNGSAGIDVGWSGGAYFLEGDAQCAGVFDGAVGPATYLVEATGATRALDPLAGGAESCLSGQSDGPGDLSASELSSNADAPDNLSGDVSFERAGNVVLAHASLSDGSEGYDLEAALVFTGSAPSVPNCALAAPWSMTANVSGIAVLSRGGTGQSCRSGLDVDPLFNSPVENIEEVLEYAECVQSPCIANFDPEALDKSPNENLQETFDVTACTV